MKISNLTLSEYCSHITGDEPRLLPPDHKLGARLVCPEYSKSDQEVKTYPLPPNERRGRRLCRFPRPARYSRPGAGTLLLPAAFSIR